MTRGYAVTFSGRVEQDPICAGFGIDVSSDWSDTYLLDAESEEDAIAKAKIQAGRSLPRKGTYETKIELFDGSNMEK